MGSESEWWDRNVVYPMTESEEMDARKKAIEGKLIEMRGINNETIYLREPKTVQTRDILTPGYQEAQDTERATNIKKLQQLIEQARQRKEIAV